MNKMPQAIDHSVWSDRRRTIDIVNRGLKRRYRAERRFKIYGVVAITLSLAFLALLNSHDPFEGPLEKLKALVFSRPYTVNS